MGNSINLVRYSQLNPEFLKNELTQRYDWKEETISCKLFTSGINDIYIVKTKSDTYYLRISLAGRLNRLDYEEEIFIINSLSEKGVNVTVPVSCLDESFIWEIDAPEGKRYAVLFTEAKQSPSEDKVKQMNNLGSMLAKLHIISDEMNYKVSRAPIDLEQLAKKTLELIQPYLINRTDDYQYLCETADKLSRFVEDHFSKEKPHYGYCHGDSHGGNVFFDGDIPKIFDFDCMGYGWRAYDICVYAWNETFGNDKYMDSDTWKAFLEGYQSERPLSDLEQKGIYVFAALRDIWLMGLHADVMERNAGCCWYNDGYFDYHIGIVKLWCEKAFY